MLKEQLDRSAQVLAEMLAGPGADLSVEEVGTLASVGQGVAVVHGLPGVKSQELVRFPNGELGLVFNLDPDEVGVLVLGGGAGLVAGMEVRRSRSVADVPVGPGLLGRVVDGLGRPLDERGALAWVERRPIERAAPAILDRAPVTAPLETGIKVVDALVPIGHGQRELILGDRQTGKTTLALDALINQRDKGVIGVYCAVGQRSDAVAKVVATLRRHEAMEHVVVVVAAGEEPPGLQFITPYAATTIAEYFMEQGSDVLIVYDDLTRHAQAYRELSLLLNRPPGREAYPGDVFYIHSRLLERATHLCDELGGGSLTALPIVETEAQNLSAYIPTNLISITDGQIYLSPQLYQKAVLPPVDVGKSVSRVGGKTQLPAYRTVAGDLRLSYAQFEELETFARFGTRLDEQTRATIERGRRVREVLKQGEHEPLSSCEQVVVLLALTHGLLDNVPLSGIDQAEQSLRWAIADRLSEICRRIHDGESMSTEDLESILGVARAALGLTGSDPAGEQPDADG